MSVLSTLPIVTALAIRRSGLRQRQDSETEQVKLKLKYPLATKSLDHLNFTRSIRNQAGYPI